MSNFNLDTVTSHIEQDFDNSVNRLIEWLKIPSVSTDPAYNDDVRKAADWMINELKGMGFDIKLIETEGHPVVFAERKSSNKDAKTLLYYGHYDVQPGDPFELWDTAPFEPAIVDSPHGKKIVARGAEDDKGQVMTFIEAFRAYVATHDALPCHIKIMLEGEEETGSPSLEKFLNDNKDILGADICVVCDTAMWDIDTPAITYSLRGLVDAQVSIKGPSRDLHSGLYGGAVINPLHALANIVSQLHDDEGKVQIPHFYDKVPPLTDAERANLAALNFDENAFLGEIDLSQPAGEAGYSTIERTYARPTCDVNGMWGGYIGEGHKTVIASEAHVKLSCRLVGDQDPVDIAKNIEKFFKDRLPEDFTMKFHTFGAAYALKLPIDSPYLNAAQEGLRTEYGRDTKMIGMGGSIPAVGAIKNILGLDSVMVGFGLSDDNIHSPNEKYELTCLRRGIRSHAAILHEIAKV
ncbi:dipeptidase [Maritalea mediterranea]|uniref:Dipeptidase n=1 Tax=Maritalea mediterranea TaxID=2909667 RepID=A0ABS9E9J9_9HYPH|nr:dipeptidase [Maritalea mediterranea]MCF4098887.1 dipeptidase [Maritalea mediterranea]